MCRQKKSSQKSCLFYVDGYSSDERSFIIIMDQTLSDNNIRVSRIFFYKWLQFYRYRTNFVFILMFIDIDNITLNIGSIVYKSANAFKVTFDSNTQKCLFSLHFTFPCVPSAADQMDMI